MKFIGKIIPVMALPLVLSCAASNPANSAKILRDCTGTYLRTDGKDYLVCNSDMLKEYETGQTVSATFEKTTECIELDGKTVCMMYHENEGNIRIKTVK